MFVIILTRFLKSLKLVCWLI